jgi:hypothetical protein
LKSWLTRSVLACATISLEAYAAGSPIPSGKPAIVLPDPEDVPQWQSWTGRTGWRVIAPQAPPNAAPNTSIDARVEALEASVLEAVRNGSVDRSRLYLAGRGEAAAAVFYTVSRAPDLWAAAVALGGSPEAAIDTGRFYTANFQNVPLLWVGTSASDEALAGQLKQAGLNLEWRSAKELPVAAMLDWLAGHTREDFPLTVDCESASATFARCYWVRLTKFDAAERNEVLPSSRIAPTIRPALGLGGYGYKIDDPGPGILISFLPEKYSGPLKIGDRIVALEGRPIVDAQAYGELMAEFKRERPVAVMVQRGKERLRLETAVVLPSRPAALTARVEASFDPATREIQIMSRTVAEMQVTIPPQWTPSVLTWNGVPLEKLERVGGEPRCFLLRIEKELENSGPCP